MVLLQQSVKFDRMINCSDWLSGFYSHSDCFVFAFFPPLSPSCQAAKCKLIINFVNPVKCGHKQFIEMIIWLKSVHRKSVHVLHYRELKQALEKTLIIIVDVLWEEQICVFKDFFCNSLISHEKIVLNSEVFRRLWGPLHDKGAYN